MKSRALDLLPPVITIDGPSGTGKGTICSLLAEHLGWHQLDSGVIYRVLALAIEQAQLDMSDIALLADTALTLDLTFGEKGAVFLGKHDVSAEIRTELCGQMASKVSSIKAVRDALLARQQAFLKPPGLVTDGRDMGTVVFPDAPMKFFLTASLPERSRRRFEQLKARGICVSLAQVVSEITVRDERDRSRAFSPLKPANDAIVIDTTALSVSEVFALMLRIISQHQGVLGEETAFSSRDK
ncbi:MAG: (d)CMP kinase [Gammaproteobacteria bacterium]|nr:(d)CMP kinase [Gammaproteobacteria bacterium]